MPSPHIPITAHGKRRALAKGAAPSPFEALLRQLQVQHDCEVGRLRDEIAVLRAAPSIALAAPPLEDTGAESTAEVETPATLATTEPPLDFSADTAATPKRSIGFRSESAMRLKAYLGAHEKKHWGPWFRDMLMGPGEIFVGVCIVVNVMVAFVQLEMRGRAAGAEIGSASSGDYESTLERLSFVTLAFTLFFAVEQVVKLSVLGCQLFRAHHQLQWFNIFDATIVVLSVIDECLASTVDTGSNFSVLRGFRVIRVLRVLRIARSLKVFASLRVLVSAVFASFLALFWSMVLLGVVMLTAALFMCQAVNFLIEDLAYDFEIRAWAYRYYGTSCRACWTLFELTFSGGWPTYARPLVEQVSAGYGVFFALYISAVTFAMFRIITALFLKDTLRAASLDVDNTIDEKLAEKEFYTQKLADFFHAADTSGDGHLTMAEFDSVLSNKHLKAYLATLELDASKARELFAILDDGDSLISVEEFVTGAIKLKGTARSQDVAILAKDVSRVHAKLDTMDTALQTIQQCLHAPVH